VCELECSQPAPRLTAEDALELYDLMERNGINACIDGGWGVDALLGEQTRSHADLDIAIEHKDVPRLRELLEPRGYADVERPDTQDCNFVLGDGKGREVDVHTYTFDSDGNHVYGIPYPAASLTGTGVINGHAVRCISLEGLLNFREKYTPDAGDIADIQRVCDRFGVPPPRNYTGLMPT